MSGTAKVCFRLIRLIAPRRTLPLPGRMQCVQACERPLPVLPREWRRQCWQRSDYHQVQVRALTALGGGG